MFRFIQGLKSLSIISITFTKLQMLKMFSHQPSPPLPLSKQGEKNCAPSVRQKKVCIPAFSPFSPSLPPYLLTPASVKGWGREEREHLRWREKEGRGWLQGNEKCIYIFTLKIDICLKPYPRYYQTSNTNWIYFKWNIKKTLRILMNIKIIKASILPNIFYHEVFWTVLNIF